VKIIILIQEEKVVVIASEKADFMCLNEDIIESDESITIKEKTYSHTPLVVEKSDTAQKIFDEIVITSYHKTIKDLEKQSSDIDKTAYKMSIESSKIKNELKIMREKLAALCPISTNSKDS